MEMLTILKKTSKTTKDITMHPAIENATCYLKVQGPFYKTQANMLFYSNFCNLEVLDLTEAECIYVSTSSTVAHGCVYSSEELHANTLFIKTGEACPKLKKILVRPGTTIECCEVENGVFEGVEESEPTHVECKTERAIKCLEEDGELRYFYTTDKEYIVPENITSIAPHAFDKCKKLERVVFHAGISLPEELFKDNETLRSVVLPSDMTRIPEGMFKSCENLETVEIPERLQEIGASAFSYCSSLKGIVLPETLVSIEDYAFFWCNSLKLKKLPEGIKKIGACAVNNKLVMPYLGSVVTDIPAHFFMRDDKIKKISIPKGVVSIGKYAFSGLVNLESVKLPSTLKTIDKDAFYGCKLLKQVNLPDGLKI